MAEQLEDLAAAIRACRICRDAPERLPGLPHEPRPVLHVGQSARIAICGQAPGTRVQASGTAFTDPSGERLRDWMGIGEEAFYDTSRIAIVPMGFCFPGLDAKGSDLPPRRECAALWHDRLFAALPQLELVLTIGQYAQAYHLGAKRKKTLTATIQAWREIYDADAPRRYLPLPHPSWRNNAWLKKHPFFERDLLPVLRKEVRSLLAKSH